MEAEARERRELEEDMRRAIARDEFELHYQTIVDVGKQECCGAEALVRWRHPERGLMAPDQFINLAEESGLIVPLGEWILRKGLRRRGAVAVAPQARGQSCRQSNSSRRPARTC